MSGTRPGPRPATIVLDCDGVVLDSNRAKTEAFHDVAARYGDGMAAAMVRHHVEHAGVSRYRKLAWLLEQVGEPIGEGAIAALAAEFADRVADRLLTCRAAAGLHELRRLTRDAGWAMVSGGDQKELRSLFAARGLEALFDKGIHGSPASKDEIFARLASGGELQAPAVYIGDSRYDHEAASRAGLDFVFVHGWSEFQDWREYCSSNRIPFAETLADAVRYCW